MMSAQMLAAATNNAETLVVNDSMKMLDAAAEESRAPVVIHFVNSTSITDSNKYFLQPVAKPLARPGSNIMFVRSETQPATSSEDVPVTNPDEIDIDQDDDDEEGEAAIEEQQVPRQVFGSLKKDDEDEGGD